MRNAAATDGDSPEVAAIISAGTMFICYLLVVIGTSCEAG